MRHLVLQRRNICVVGLWRKASKHGLIMRANFVSLAQSECAYYYYHFIITATIIILIATDSFKFL